MLMGKKRFLILCLATVLVVSIGIVVAKYMAKSPQLEKTGRIKHVDYWQWRELNVPSATILTFEDGESLNVMGEIENIEVGKTYHIVYHKTHYTEPSGEWSGQYYTIDSIEELK